jgi:hypothetical protein
MLTPKGMGGDLILMLLAIIPAGSSLYPPMYTYTRRLLRLLMH